MKIFLTGGTGFIGRPVTRKLVEEGHSILLLNCQPIEEIKDLVEENKDIRLLNGDLSNIPEWKKDLRDFQPDATLHLAWEGIPDYKSQKSVKNLEYGLNLYLTLGEIGCKRIITSGSCWEYGRKTGALSEDLDPIPNNAFTAAKNALRIVGNEIAKEYNAQFVWTRFYYVYGPGQKKVSLIPSIIDSVRKNQDPQIKTPNAKNDFVYVDDVANALALILQKCKSQNAIYNIGSGFSTSILEILETVYNNFGRPLPKVFSSNPTQKVGETVDFWANLNKINKEIGWSPDTTIADGIKKMIAAE